MAVAGIAAWGTGMADASTMTGVAGSAATGEKGGSQGCFSYLWACQVHRCYYCRLVGQSHGYFHSWRDRVIGLAAAVYFPVAVGTAVARKPELCAQPPLLILGSLGWQGQLLWLGGGAGTQALLSLCPQFFLLYVLQSTHL